MFKTWNWSRQSFCHVILDRQERGSFILMSKVFKWKQKLLLLCCCLSRTHFSKWFKIAPLETTTETLTRLLISIQKKNMETKVGFQLRNFCTYAECFAKEHEHWGENILKIKFRKKKNWNAVRHFSTKSAKTSSANASMLENRSLVFSRSLTGLLNVDTPLHIAVNVGSVQFNRKLTDLIFSSS